MDLDTWVSLAALLGTAAALYGLMVRQLDSFKADVKASFAGLDAKVDAVRGVAKDDAAELGKKVDATRSELTEKLDATRSELTEKLDATRSEFTARIDETRKESKADIADLGSTLRAAIQGLDDRVYALATGLHLPTGPTPAAAGATQDAPASGRSGGPARRTS